MTPIRALVAGLGEHGPSHALAYPTTPASRSSASSTARRPLPGARRLRSIRRLPEALRAPKPDLVSINTYSDSHADYAVMAMEAGATSSSRSRWRPRSPTPSGWRRRQGHRPQAGGRLHPAPPPVLAEADRRGAQLGGPFVFRMNLNQQSSGRPGDAQGADADHLADRRLRRPLRRRDVPDHRRQAGRGARHGPAPHRRDRADMYNYGHLQVLFDDGSVGWYEAGWGPMMSETAFFVKDVISPNGAVSIVMPERQVRRHRHPHQDLGAAPPTATASPTRNLAMADEPGHQDALRPRAGLRRPRSARTSTSPATWRTPSASPRLPRRRRERAHRPPRQA